MTDPIVCATSRHGSASTRDVITESLLETEPWQHDEPNRTCRSERNPHPTTWRVERTNCMRHEVANQALTLTIGFARNRNCGRLRTIPVTKPRNPHIETTGHAAYFCVDDTTSVRFPYMRAEPRSRRNAEHRSSIMSSNQPSMTFGAAKRGPSWPMRFDAPSESARLLLVDDHAEVRTSLRRLLAAENWTICGEAADGVEAIEATRRTRPNVIIMDLFMPRMCGIDAAHVIRNEFPTMLVMLVTATLDPGIEEAARNVGIRGTASKAATDCVLRGIRALLNGEQFHQLSKQ